jgi:hypothetical protein
MGLDPRLMAPVQMDGFANAFREGRQQRDQNIAKAAYAALVRDPNNQKAFEALAQVNPQVAQQFREQQQSQAMQAVEQHRDAIKVGATIIRQMKPTAETWPQARSALRQYGIDPDALGVPQDFQPEYLNQIVSLADALNPQARENRSRIITPQPGGGAFELGEDGNLRELIRPNDGSQPMGAPAAGAPQPGQVEDGYRFKGGNPADPNAWEPIGGQTPQASGGFPPSGN